MSARRGLALLFVASALVLDLFSLVRFEQSFDRDGRTEVIRLAETSLEVFWIISDDPGLTR
jgi:hypothetical protein